MLALGLSFIFTVHAPLPPQTQAPAPVIPWIENVGQFDPRARYFAQGDNFSLWLTDDGLWLTILESDQHPARFPVPDPTGQGVDSRAVSVPPRGVSLHLTFPNSAPSLEPFARQQTVTSYFTPEGPFVGVPVWGGVRFANLYPGLDLDISSQDGHLTLTFVHTTEGTREIPLHIEGADALRQENGIPILSTPLGDISLPFQSATPLTLHATAGEQTLTFPASSLTPPPSSPSWLAPTGLVYSTYLGGTADDTPNTLAVNALGEIYVAGETYSLVFPDGPGLNVPTHLIAGFITKLDSSGTTLDYNINLVSAGLTENTIKDMVVDTAGNAYVGGFTDSADFPATPGAYDTVPPAATNLYKAFVMKINAAGGVEYATLLGTNTASELGNGLAVDSAGNAYITGYTQSATFPTTPGAYDTMLGGERDLFVTKFNATGSALLYSTFIGGPSKDAGERIVLDATNNAIVSGTSEDGPTYPQTVAPIGPVGTWDIVVTKLNANGNGLIYSTLIGGSSFDFYAQGLAVDPAGNAYVSGETYSADFPTTPGAYDATLNGSVDPVLFKLNPTGTALGFSTYVGGSSAGVLEFSLDLALDSNLHPYIVGYTDSADFPTTSGGFRHTLFGPTDIFVVKMNVLGTALDFATYLGGTLEDYGTTIAIQTPTEFMIAGSSYSTDYPTTLDAYAITSKGGADGVLSAFGPLPYSVFMPVVKR